MNKLIPKIIFISAALIIIVSSCNEKNANDESLTVNEYIKAGLPDPARQWQTNDYALAFAVLENVKATRPHYLPRKDSEKSGEIFVRILGRDDMRFLNNNAMSNDEKVLICRELLKVCERTINLYTISSSGQEYYHRELTDAYLFGLEMTDAMIDLKNQTEIIRGYDNTDPIQSVYLSGLFNLLRTQNSASDFAADDHEMMINSIRNSVEKNKFWFNDNIKADLRAAFQQISDSTKAQGYNANYLDFLGSI